MKELNIKIKVDTSEIDDLIEKTKVIVTDCSSEDSISNKDFAKEIFNLVHMELTKEKSEVSNLIYKGDTQQTIFEILKTLDHKKVLNIDAESKEIIKRISSTKNSILSNDDVNVILRSIKNYQCPYCGNSHISCDALFCVKCGKEIIQ